LFWLLRCDALLVGDVPMLQFSYYRSNDLEEWRLVGRLAGPWADELRTVWRRIRHHVPHGNTVVDVQDMTSIDECGERLLAEMQSAGARLILPGVEHKHLSADLKDAGTSSPPRSIGHAGGGR
jgi:hypothetical protein